MVSLKTRCLAILPGAFLQSMAWRPWASTTVPQWQLCGTHKLSPSLIPTATRTASSSRRKPQLAIGRARSQSPQYYCAAFNAPCVDREDDGCTAANPLQRHAVVIIWDRQTDGRSPFRYVDPVAYYARGVSNGRSRCSTNGSAGLIASDNHWLVCVRVRVCVCVCVFSAAVEFPTYCLHRR